LIGEKIHRKFRTPIYLKVANRFFIASEQAGLHHIGEVEGSWNKSTNNMRIRSNPSLNMHQRRSLNMKKNKTLSILKNGSLRSLSGELKSCMVKNFGQVILCNTCAFDSIASILMVAYCDSVNYNIAISSKENIFMKFITGIVKNGISAKTYSIRAEILVCL
jgi:hypothetical protein